FTENDIIKIHTEYSNFTLTPWMHNAQLRGEQRLHPNLKHCAINAKFEVEARMPSVVNPS
ncbi:hypothetical protein M2G92_22035, partial [Vibrio vulnificus]|nr:hypothetical protein [Vibrio vulnificus]